jgi:hypothetical protein
MIAKHFSGWTTMSRLCAIFTLSAFLAACAHPTKTKTATAPEQSKDPGNLTGLRVLPNSGIASAATKPFEDIGLKRDRVPETLASIKTPYSVDPASTCFSLGQEIAALDAVLGVDVDAKLAEQSWRQKGVNAAGDALLDAIEATSTSVIPFRGVVREVSGASKRDREIAAATQAGKLRRAFLKGIGVAKECAPPAAPLPLPADQQD